MSGSEISNDSPTLCDKQYSFLNDQLTRANDSRLHQDTLTWTLFSIILGANAILVSTLFQTSNSNFESIKWMIPVFGILLSSGWLIAQWRILHYYCIYEKLVVSIENKLMVFQLPYHTHEDLHIVKEPSKFKSYLHLAPFICIIFWIFELWV